MRMMVPVKQMMAMNLRRLTSVMLKRREEDIEEPGKTECEVREVETEKGV